MGLGQPNEALAVLESELAKGRAHQPVYFLALGEAAHRAGALDKAVAYFKRAQQVRRGRGAESSKIRLRQSFMPGTIFVAWL